MSNLKVMITPEQIDERVLQLGEQLTSDYQGEDILYLTILNGSFIFSADLIRCIQNDDIEVRFLRAKSYVGTQSTGDVKSIPIESIDFAGKNVLIVEDIVDTGRTLSVLKQQILRENPKSLKIVTFLDKPARRVVELKPDYIGFEIPDKFAVGYGLDSDEKYRQLPYVGELV